jgi:dihydrofolate reductase
MPRVVLFMSVSLDGFIAGPDDDLGWHRVDDELHSHFNEVLAGMGAFWGGRRTWELMAGYWPTADEDPSAPAVEAEFAAIWRETPKVVFSRTLASAGWDTRIERSVSVESVRTLLEEADGDVVVGGAVLARAFLELDLVDEMRIYVHPVLVGSGAPLFTGPGPALDFELVESRAFANGVVLLRHQRSRENR